VSALPPKATMDAYLSDVRYGPEADIANLSHHVRFTPNLRTFGSTFGMSDVGPTTEV